MISSYPNFVSRRTSHLQVGMGKRAGPSRVRPIRISTYWQQIGPVRPASYTDQINWSAPALRTLVGQMDRSAGLVLKKILILIKIQYNQIKFNTHVNKISIISQLHQ